MLADEWQGRGLGKKLLASLLSAASANDVRRALATTLSTNEGMLALARRLSFALAPNPASPAITDLTLVLAETPRP